MIKRTLHLFCREVRKIYTYIVSSTAIAKIRCKLIFYGNMADHKSYKTTGLSHLMVARRDRFRICEKFRMNNTMPLIP